jgi:rRNA maturation endonuclease Nob1
MYSNNDKASDQELNFLEFSILSVRSRINLERRYQYTGYCLHCFEEVEKPKLFCNGECADAFAKKKGI